MYISVIITSFKGESMFNNVTITKDGKKDIIDISGRRFNQITELSEDDLSRLLKINSELFKFYTNWYLLDGNLFYFKTDYIFNEIFLSELAHEFNVKCVQFMLAKDGKNLGIISRNFRKKTFNYYDYMEFCNLFFGEIPSDIETFKSHMYAKFDKENADKLMEQIFSLIAFDFFSGQNDRTHINVTFEEKMEMYYLLLCVITVLLFIWVILTLMFHVLIIYISHTITLLILHNCIY